MGLKLHWGYIGDQLLFLCVYDPVVCDPGGLCAGVLDWESVCDLVVK